MQEFEALISFIPLVVLILVFYFLVFRPQQQQRKRHAEMVAELKRGDKIVTNGGFVCEVIKQDEQFLLVNLGDNQVKLSKDYVAYRVDDFPETKAKDSESKSEKNAK